MHYKGVIIRPPSEADSILLQVTTGCSHNKCTFCGAYKDQGFRIKKPEIISEDIAFARQYCTKLRRVFLCDGDALIMPQKRLIGILAEIRQQLPWVTRIGTYANAKSLKMKSLGDLGELKELGLGIIYTGLETGDDETLGNIRKGVDSATIIEECRKVRDAGIRLSVTVILGLAGPQRSRIHARETGRALSAIDPEYTGALTLMLMPGTPMHDDWAEGRFTLMNPEEILEELKTMITHTSLSRGLFFTNHASNYLSLQIRLPRDKDMAIHLIDKALEGQVPLRPEGLRAL